MDCGCYLLRNSIYIGSLEQRVIDSVGCDIGVSIHCDAFGASTANGFSVFHYPGSEMGIKLAKDICFALEMGLEGVIKSRGIKPNDYYIIRKTAFPCVLVECGFLSNVADEKALSDYYVQETIARAVAYGVVKYTF